MMLSHQQKCLLLDPVAGSKNATSNTNKTATQILILGKRVRQREREGERREKFKPAL